MSPGCFKLQREAFTGPNPDIASMTRSKWLKSLESYVST